MLQSIEKYLKKDVVTKNIGGNSTSFTRILEWKSKGLSNESIKSIATSNYGRIQSPNPNFLGTEARVEFTGGLLKQDKTTFNHGTKVNI